MTFLLLGTLFAIAQVQPAPAPVVHPAPAPIIHSAPAPVYHAPVYHAPVYHAPSYHAPAAVPPRQVIAPSTTVPRAASVSVPYHARNGAFIANPRNWEWWAWNRYAIWHPVASYWGGGFWGRWSMLNPPVLTSYSVAPGSPGAQLLGDYGLAQTRCGVGNLVVIHGPDNSTICAYPNGLVSAGTYNLDPATLTLQLQY